MAGRRLTDRRNGMCDLLRFIFSMFIMAFHTSLLGVKEPHPFSEAWIFVEFYFLLSGYYTANHFSNIHGEIDSSRYAQESILYTLKKIKGTLPYAVPCIAAAYILEASVILAGNGRIAEVLGLLSNMPFELLQLTASGIGSPHDGTTWYLSAIFLITPPLSYILLRYSDLFKNILCWLIPVVCIGEWLTFGQATSGIFALLRGFVWMSLGVLAFNIGSVISSISLTHFKRLALTGIEAACFLLCVLLTYFNIRYYRTFYLSIFTGTTIMLSMCSYTDALKWKGFSILGKISLPIYLSHWVIGRAVRCMAAVANRYDFPFPMYLRIILYYIFTILISTMMYLSVDKRKKIKV